MKLMIAVMTCFNRRQQTADAIGRYFACALPTDIARELILVDDGSTDGTAEAIEMMHPSVEVIKSKTPLFWNRGMHLAQSVAMTKNANYLLWLNDDTALVDDALERLLKTATELERSRDVPVIVVGATADSESGKITYSGQVSRSNFRPFTYHKVFSPTIPMACETMNGNVVLIPAAALRLVGNLDPTFEHAMGDIDYALRARKLGIEIYVAAGVVGYCSNNSSDGTYNDTSLPLRVRWGLMLSRKGLPWRSWLHLTRTHGGIFWLIYFTWPYSKVLVQSLAISILSKFKRQSL